jgi:hypothetical protein
MDKEEARQIAEAQTDEFFIGDPIEVSDEFVEDVMNFDRLADQRPELRRQLEVVQDLKRYAEDNAKITNWGRIVATEPGGNAKNEAKLPMRVALWLVQHAPATLIDDKLWHSFLEANPQYKFGQR